MYLRHEYKNEIKRLSKNYQAVIQANEIQQEITLKEYKKYYEDSLQVLTNKLKIKSKHIENVIVTKYNYKDTTITTYQTVYEPGKDETLIFLGNKGCFNVSGSVERGNVTISKVEVNDILTTFTYKDFEKKFLFIKWKSFYTTKVYSDCKKDTVLIQSNIKIIKRNGKHKS
jgi:hypothetical protein